MLTKYLGKILNSPTLILGDSLLTIIENTPKCNAQHKYGACENFLKKKKKRCF